MSLKNFTNVTDLWKSHNSLRHNCEVVLVSSHLQFNTPFFLRCQLLNDILVVFFLPFMFYSVFLMLRPNRGRASGSSDYWVSA